jgi:hypothetical protein
MLNVQLAPAAIVLPEQPSTETLTLLAVPML